MLRGLTLVNVPPTVPPEDIAKFSDEFQFLEWMIHSDAVFLAGEWTQRVVDGAKNYRVALNLGTTESGEFLSGNADWALEKCNPIFRFRRIQIDLPGVLEDWEIDIPEIDDMLAHLQAHSDGPWEHCFLLPVHSSEHQRAAFEACSMFPDFYPVFDFSKQTPPANWPFADYPLVDGEYLRAHGYWGDFTSQNIVSEMKKIIPVTQGGPFWIQVDFSKFIINDGVYWKYLRPICEAISPHHRKGG